MSAQEQAAPGSRLVVITGLPGSGKTTLSRKLAPILEAVRICPDEWMMASGLDLWTMGLSLDRASRA